MHPRFPGAHMHIRINGATIQDERFVLQQGIQVGPGEEGLGDLSRGRGSRPWASSFLSAESRNVRRGYRKPGAGPDWHRPGRPAAHTPAKTRRSADGGCHAPGPD